MARRYMVLVDDGEHQIEIPVSLPSKVQSRALALDMARGLRDRGWNATAYLMKSEDKELP